MAASKPVAVGVINVPPAEFGNEYELLPPFGNLETINWFTFENSNGVEVLIVFKLLNSVAVK